MPCSRNRSTRPALLQRLRSRYRTLPHFPPVLILAGGLGTRIRSICADLPKSLVPVNGEPFVAHQMRLLAREGVRDVVMCVGHRSRPLIDFLGDGEQFGLNVRYSEDGDRLLGTGGAIVKASALASSPFAVLYGDSYLDVPFGPVYETFVKSGKLGLMTVFRNENRFIPSNLLVENGLVTAYNKTNPTPNMVHADFGLSIYSAAAFAGRSQTVFDLNEVVMNLIERRELAAFETLKRFYEVGSPEGVADLEQYLTQPH